MSFLNRKVNKQMLLDITLYIEDDDESKVDFNDGTMTFTVMLIKV